METDPLGFPPLLEPHFPRKPLPLFHVLLNLAGVSPHSTSSSWSLETDARTPLSQAGTWGLSISRPRRLTQGGAAAKGLHSSHKVSGSLRNCFQSRCNSYAISPPLQSTQVRGFWFMKKGTHHRHSFQNSFTIPVRNPIPVSSPPSPQLLATSNLSSGSLGLPTQDISCKLIKMK